VINLQRLDQIVGGVNYFAAFPINNTLRELDELLLSYDGKGFTDCSILFIVDVLSHIESENQESDWNSQKYINALNGRRKRKS
jgi:hypothetical protein